MKIKRAIAYMLDFILVYFATSFLFMLPCFEKDLVNITEFNEEYMAIVDEQINNTGSADVDEDLLYHLQYEMYDVSSNLLIVRLGVLFVYFGVIQYVCKGQTIGKKIMKIKIVANQGDTIKPGLFIIREILVTNIIPEIISLVALLVASEKVWIDISVITTYMSYITMFALIGVMIFRTDERGLHDVIANTKVISTKEK